MDLLTAGKFCSNLSHVLGSVLDYANANPSTRVVVNYALHDAQNVCAVTIVGTVLRTSVQCRQ